jgi:hypothetical protein
VQQDVPITTAWLLVDTACHSALLCALDEQVFKTLAVAASSLIDGRQCVIFCLTESREVRHGLLRALDEETYLTLGGAAQLLNDSRRAGNVYKNPTYILT